MNKGQPVNKGQPKEKSNMKSQISGLYPDSFLITEYLLKCGLYFQDGLYSEVVFKSGLTVFVFRNMLFSINMKYLIFGMLVLVLL